MLHPSIEHTSSTHKSLKDNSVSLKGTQLLYMCLLSPTRALGDYKLDDSFLSTARIMLIKATHIMRIVRLVHYSAHVQLS